MLITSYKVCIHPFRFYILQHRNTVLNKLQLSLGQLVAQLLKHIKSIQTKQLGNNSGHWKTAVTM